MQVLVNLDSKDRPRYLAQSARQRSNAGSNLQHDVVGTNLGGASDQIDKIQIDEKVLTELGNGSQSFRSKSPRKITRRLAVLRRDFIG
jgi:hypothetical protein